MFRPTALLFSTVLTALWVAPAMASGCVDYEDGSFECWPTPTVEVRPKDTVTAVGVQVRAGDQAETIAVLNPTITEPFDAPHPAELLNTVAGVNIHRGSGQEHLTAIRSPVLTGGAGAGSFLYALDGVPLRAAGFANVNGLLEAPTEIAQRIEVFKGPGPADFGSNAVHGLINIVPDDRGNRLRLFGSSRGLVSATAGKELGDDTHVGLHLAHDGGFRDDSGFDQQKLTVQHDTVSGQWGISGLLALNNLNQETAGFLQGDDAYRDRELIETNAFPEAFRDTQAIRLQLRAERDIDAGTLILQPYARRTQQRFLRHFVPGQALDKNGHTSAGLRGGLYGEGWSIGGEAEYTKGFQYEFQDNPDRFSFTQGLHYDYEVDAVVLAGFAKRDIALGEDTQLQLGLRGEYTSYDYDNLASVGRSGRFIRVADRADDFFTLTPKIGLTHDTDVGTFFARAARGSRAPQTLDLYSVQQNQVPGEADVETLDSLEAGWRDDLGDIEFEVTGFTMWKDNFFFRNANGFNVVNGKTRHEGVEARFDWDLSPRLSLSGNGSLARHTYDFTEDVGSPANNITDGDRVDSAPDTLGDLRIRYDIPSGPTFWADVAHVGSYFTNPGNTNRYPGHEVFGAGGAIDITDDIRLDLRLENLFDVRYADRADFAFGNERYFPGRPRTVFAGLTVSLD